MKNTVDGGQSYTADPNPCRVIGVLDNGVLSLSALALVHLRSADVVIGATRTLALLHAEFKHDVQCFDLTGQLTQVPEWVRNARKHHQKSVVLATGDPLCHGIAAYLANHLCIEALEILPNLSTLQLACARVGLTWQDAKILSVHAKDAGEWAVGASPSHGLYALAQAVRQHARLLILTSPDNTPARIAKLLQCEGLSNTFQMAVAENLCQADERIYSQLNIDDAATMTFAPLNVVILWRTELLHYPVLFGLPDTAYQQRQPEKGLITKQEIRAVSLARLQLQRNSLVWDIGAGSGSVGLEAARLCCDGHVFAIEKNIADFEIAQHNHRDYQLSNYTLVQGKAPAGLDNWPDPDAVFIGGSGGELTELIACVLARLNPGGRLVMNFVTLENLQCATEALKNNAALQWDVLQLQAARSKPILHMHRMSAENPVWQVCACKIDGVSA